MSDLRDSPGPGNTNLEPDPDLASTPRWVKVFGIIAVLGILLFVGLMLFGGGRHGPGRHFG